MAEGPLLHRFAREQNRDLSGRRVRVAAAQARFAREARGLDRKVFDRAEARGKHLFHHWRDGSIVHVHLGMFGDFERSESPAAPPRPSVRMRLSARGATWDLIGPPVCELVDGERRQAILDRLGPDPIFSRAGMGVFAERLRRTDRPIGQALLDQRVVAGVGNIYRAEILFVTRIHPLRPSSSLTRPELRRLWSAIRRLLNRGVRQRRIRTTPMAKAAGGRERDVRRFYVYQQESCLTCGSRVRVLDLSGRKMFACDTCQPLRGRPQGARRHP